MREALRGWGNGGYHAQVASPHAPERLPFTGDPEADSLLASDPLALLIGFTLDQQITVQKAFMGPLDILRRVGSLDPAVLASTDLEPVFRERPAIHRLS